MHQRIGAQGRGEIRPPGVATTTLTSPEAADAAVAHGLEVFQNSLSSLIEVRTSQNRIVLRISAQFQRAACIRTMIFTSAPISIERVNALIVRFWLTRMRKDQLAYDAGAQLTDRTGSDWPVDGWNRS
jgi:hypothetical protein